MRPETLLIVPQIMKKLAASYGILMLPAAFERARHLSIFWARQTQFKPSHPISTQHILILPSHLSPDLSSSSFLQAYPPNNWTNLSPIRATCSAPPRFQHPSTIWWGGKIKKLLIMHPASSCFILLLLPASWAVYPRTLSDYVLSLILRTKPHTHTGQQAKFQSYLIVFILSDSKREYKRFLTKW